MNRKRLRIIFLCLGLLATIFALALYGKDVGANEQYKSYGGDAYTGIQQAAAQTANNVFDLAEIVQNGLASILLIHGGILTGISVCIEVPKEEKIKEDANQGPENQSEEES